MAPQQDHDPERFIEQLANQIQRYDMENERLQRLQGILAVGVVKLERYAQAMAAEVEMMKSQMAGVTQFGFDPPSS